MSKLLICVNKINRQQYKELTGISDLESAVILMYLLINYLVQCKPAECLKKKKKVTHFAWEISDNFVGKTRANYYCR